MPHEISGANAWVATVTVPSTGDSADESAWQAGLQDLADRTQYLRTTLDSVGGGGMPSDVAPAGVATVGAAGIATAYARGDHAHALGAPVVRAALASGTAIVLFNGQELGALGAPQLSTSAARMAELDAVRLASTLHPSVRVADIGSAPYTGPITVSGVTLAMGDRYARVGVGGNCGIWIVQFGAHTRALDWAVGRVINGDCFVVAEGTDYPGEMMAAYGPPAVVGTDAVSLDTVNRPETLYGDVTEASYGTRVVRLRGDAVNGNLLIEARSIKQSESSYNTFSKVYHRGLATGGTLPIVAETHYFASTGGAIKAILEVDLINAAGVVESFHVRETRKFDGTSAATLIDVSRTLYTPVAPTGSAVLTWSANSVKVTVTAPSAVNTRWNVNLQVFEMPAA